MRRVLHLRAVTQCAMLEDFGIFLVLADKVRDEDFRGLFTAYSCCSRSLLITSRRLCPHHLEQRTFRRHPKN